jgi:hypothetical protein
MNHLAAADSSQLSWKASASLTEGCSRAQNPIGSGRFAPKNLRGGGTWISERVEIDDSF